jgi:HTH-type transcriptional regulator/antitoxin HipB
MILHSAKEVGALVRDRRTGLGLSQLQLAEKVGVSRVWMVQFERGKPNAQLGLVLRTLRELGVPLKAEVDQDSHSSRKIDLGSIINRHLENP